MESRVDGRSERKVTNREIILSAARQLIDTNGSHGFSMRQLAAKADVSVATLYNLFESREAIVRACFEKVNADLSTDFDALRGASDLCALCEGLVASADLVLNSVSGAMYLKLTDDIAVLKPFLGEHRASDGFAPELEAAVRRGELNEDTDIDVLRTVVEAVVGTAMRLSALGVISADERRHRIRSGSRLALLAEATDLGRNSFMTDRSRR
ncbi:MAG: TetR/AcrR family transcriptional regulator [Actinobacteria bacterium]|nr:TetR/AcrR family transcriptional regulator [Actinomycetota bacterium]